MKKQSFLRTFRRKISYSDQFINFLAGLLSFLIILYSKSLKIKFIIHPLIKRSIQNKLLVGFWHGRLFLLIPSFTKWDFVILTDLSWAGELLTCILKRFGYEVVRGSSKRQGIQGLFRIIYKMKEGYSGALAVDGPRGPVFKTKPGVLLISRKMDYPIVPLTFGANRFWILKKTWDQFLIPKPFSKCIVAMGHPIYPTSQNGQYTVEQLNQTLMNWTTEIDTRLK